MTADRFQWLEFEEGRDPTSPAAPDGRTPVEGGRRAPDSGRDAAWHIREAARAFDDGRFEPALRHFSAALKDDANLEEAWAGQARCMVALGQLRQAVVWGQKGTAQLPSSTLMASTLSYVLAHARHLPEAMAISDEIVSKRAEALSQTPWFWHDRGVCLLARAQDESAGGCFERVIEMSGADPDWVQRLAYEYLQADAPTRALSLLNAALEKRVDRAYLWVLTARAAARLHLDDRAREAHGQAVALDPSHPELSKEPVPLAPNQGARPCWIATLVFESPTHPVVEAIRDWRDRVWMRTPTGRAAAAFYHATAPAVCTLLARHTRLHAPLRRGLTRLGRWVAPARDLRASAAPAPTAESRKRDETLP